ncbi:uncharacterized protein LOC106636689 [Copidosoma floridanum]|uniref:uncharacterized protein LOC106636689 n=1 Tax=Copidosoma floridanum TaxID=29053 RepID=UPI0006C9BD81|nr:uncharacterized protein LOC106636689 [Copidosoma floridanum]
MTNPINILRDKFASDLEELLQCPVCCETLSTTVPTCVQGHHVCLKCQPQLSVCPYCKGDFNGTRNYLAESLLTKFEEIKSSLINPKTNASRTDMICVETQTDWGNDISGSTPLIKTDLNQNVQKKSKVVTAVGKGRYPCKFENCNTELGHGRMIPHFRYYHKENLIEEKLVDFGKYVMEWEHNCLDKKYERVISIPDMGLFYLYIAINEAGDLQGNLQIINSALVAKQFNYSLLLGNQNTSMSYNGQVTSCRTTLEKIKTKSLFVNSLCMSQLMGEKQTVNCSLVVQKVVDDLTKMKK